MGQCGPLQGKEGTAEWDGASYALDGLVSLVERGLVLVHRQVHKLNLSVCHPNCNQSVITAIDSTTEKHQG